MPFNIDFFRKRKPKRSGPTAFSTESLLSQIDGQPDRGRKTIANIAKDIFRQIAPIQMARQVSRFEHLRSAFRPAHSPMKQPPGL
jgi:hypothetical protein